ncbi:MAG: glycosyltransferase [Firmicutes bacterium HGW-Firmicutes-15]|nr:MAG: glycosyltransferase [Firmicutes bacterium HGW-Firmicutes-15]
MKRNVRYTVIIPVYNEEAVIQESYHRLTRVMQSTGEPYELLFINDGSGDRTAEFIEGFAERDECVKLLDFSRNFGHQIAITAGMDYALGDAIVIIDADLQDPPELIPQMIEKWKEGYEVVYAMRSQRKGETLFKKWTAAFFYRLLGALAEVKIPPDTGDFRLIDRKVCDAMHSIREKNRFVRGLVSWVGFRQTAIEYVREERYAGETKYPLKKMLRFSMDGITSFSYKPLKLATYLGFVVSFASFVYLLISLGEKIFTASTTAGWSSLIACLMLLNGVILILFGIIGEYIGRIYDETKDRPLYILRNKQKIEKVKLKEVKWSVQ